MARSEEREEGGADGGDGAPATPPAQASQGMVRSTVLVGGLTLLSRVAGLFRETTLARFLGTGVEADAFRVAFLIPNLLRRLVGEGAVTSVFVAVYSRLRGDTTTFVQKFLTLWGVLVALVTVLGIVLVGPLAHLVRPLLRDGDLAAPANLELTIELTRIVFWYLLFVGSMAAIQGVLNARGRFGAPAFVPLLFNLVFIGGTWALVPFFPPGDAVFAVSFAAVAGGAAQFLFLAVTLRRHGVRLRPRWPFDHSGVREVLRLMVPGTIGAGVYQLNVAINTAIAASLSAGSVSSLGYSNRLLEFVLGIFVIALSTVSLTSLSRLAARGDRKELARRAVQVFRLVLFITIPSTVGLYVVGEPVASVILLSGSFDAESLALVLAAFRFHLPGLVFVGLVRVLVATCHAQKDLRGPIVASAIVLPLNVLLAAGLAASPLRHAGIALASSLAALAHAAILFAICRAHLPALRLRLLGGIALRSTIASLVMAAACLALAWLWPFPDGKLPQAFWVLVVVSAGAAVYATGAAVLKIEEFFLLARGIFRRSR